VRHAGEKQILRTVRGVGIRPCQPFCVQKPLALASVRSPTMKIDAEEKELLESVERSEWKSAGGGKRERARFSRYAKATSKKDRRLNIRLSSKDLEAIQRRALAEGLPYQTLIASLLHKYAAGRLKEI
jgi:predicted DNA binding CopG/RHH family protein